MIAILSPAKQLDFTIQTPEIPLTKPVFVKQAADIMSRLKKLSPKKIGALMGISEKLSALNYDRFQHWSETPSDENARPSVFVFRGEVYRGLDVDTLTKEQLHYTQNHVRILSGLYGIIRPLDSIQPYRLEMGTSLKIGRKKNLYDYWGDQVIDELNKALQEDDNVLINLASNEYFSVLPKHKITERLITPVFKDKAKDGSYKVKFVYAKKARGQMCRYMIDNNLTNAEDLKGFNTEGYAYTESLSSENQWVFTRG